MHPSYVLSFTCHRQPIVSRQMPRNMTTSHKDTSRGLKRTWMLSDFRDESKVRWWNEKKKDWIWTMMPITPLRCSRNELTSRDAFIQTFECYKPSLAKFLRLQELYEYFRCSKWVSMAQQYMVKSTDSGSNPSMTALTLLLLIFSTDTDKLSSQ